jgi:hypothetical protein
MELTWFMKLRIAGVMAVGVLLLGLGAWGLIEPSVPAGAITIIGADISVVDGAICIALAFAAGVIGYFAAWPYGAEIGVLAAPAGLGFWAFRTGDMAGLLRLNTALTIDETVVQRQALLSVMKWEGLFWLAVVGAGFAGVKAAERLAKAKKPVGDDEIGNVNTHNVLNVITALIVTVVIAQFALGVFAQDVRMFDNTELQSVTGQPGRGQTAFAVVVSFAIAAYIVKWVLNVSYVWPALAACGIGCYSMWLSAKADVLEHMLEAWPEAFFARSVCAILPLQLVAFAGIGSVAGYWLAIKYVYWRKHGQ